jgi:hypothetical protein
MHRRNMILRRFGDLTFGLGYFEDGEWVDHTELGDRGDGLEIPGALTETDRVAIHAWLGCCAELADPVATEVGPGAAPIPIRSQIGAPTPVLHAESHADAVAGRSSAL